MDRRKAYVFGCGQYFRNKQADIIKSYEIVAVLDNNVEGQIALLNGQQVSVVKPVVAVENIGIPIIIMVFDFYSVWKELKGLSIDPARIVFPDSFMPLTEAEQIFHDDGGGFKIVDGEIYYEDNTRKFVIESLKMIQSLPKQLERDRVNASFITGQAPIEPLNRKFGFSRGTPIDRYYIEKWLQTNKKLIKGDVLEIAEDTYTRKFGADDVVPHILHVSAEDDGVIRGNLETGEGIPENCMDCVILTQTLPFIYRCENVISNLYKILKINGSAIITTSGISQISRYDMDHWGDFWRFTEASVRRLIENSAFRKNYDISIYGNVKIACALLYGVAAEELKEEELMYVDEDYPVSICIRVTK